MSQQLIPFNQSSAGNVKGACEKNVRLGFGIAAKYLSAWSNWVNTDQHTDPIPVGLDVPVFFSYLDANNGHVGVRLANGKFWSDGTVYDSIAAYEANHAPKYVGWSTKVDNVAVIQLTEEEVDKITIDQDNQMSYLATGDKPGAGYDYRWVGQPLTKEVVNQWVNFWRDQQLSYQKQQAALKPTVLQPGTYKVN